MKFGVCKGRTECVSYSRESARRERQVGLDLEITIEHFGYEEMEGLDRDEDSLDSKMEAAQEEWRKPRVSSKAQNWCDLFFILDILASRCLP